MLKKVWNFILRRKPIDLDNDGKIESLRSEVEGVFSSFKRMNNQLIEVNTKLEAVVSDEVAIKTLAEERIERALGEMKSNQKLQNKLKDFIL